MKLILCTGLLLALSATAGFAKEPLSVTLTAQPTVVTYGSSTTLSGGVSTKASGVKVTVTAQQCGQASAKTLTSLTTATQGAWTTSTQPTVRTTYQAKAKNATSTAVTVQVRPRVTLAKVAAHRFRTRATAAQSFAGKIALFQRRTATGWKTVKSVTMGQISSGPAPTIVSGATFRSGIRTGKRVRMLLTQRQAGACYLAGISTTIRS
jgi:hypothetical protein